MNQIEGNIFQLIDEAEQYVKKNINWGVEIAGFERIEKPEIPIEALREIIVNSFAHANYIGTSRHEIDIHPGRISIYNPGSFPDGLTPEDFRARNISSRIRNEIICNVLFRCGEVESWSTGLRKVFDLCEEDHVKISYEKEYDGFWFFFIRNDTRNVTENVTRNSSINDLTELEKTNLCRNSKEPENKSRFTISNHRQNVQTYSKSVRCSQIKTFNRKSRPYKGWILESKSSRLMFLFTEQQLQTHFD